VQDLFDSANPEEGAVRRDLDKLLSLLPGRQRRLMENVKLQGLSMEEAGASTGMSPTAVRISIHRGLQALMRKVRDEDR
jgi:RNA polymerase sigma-70 factor (ECF subfamily)